MEGVGGVGLIGLVVSLWVVVEVGKIKKNANHN